MSMEAIDLAAKQTVPGIFGPLEPSRPPAAAATGGVPRVQCPDRQQAVMSWNTLDERLPEEHPARLVCAYVESATELWEHTLRSAAVPGRREW